MRGFLLDIDFLITLKRDRDRMQKLLEKHGWQDRSGEFRQTAGSRGGEGDRRESRLPVEKIEARLEELKARQQELDSGLKRSIGERRDELGSLWTRLRIAELSHQLRHGAA